MKTDQPLVMGIESSCDETGVGVVRGTTLLADAVAFAGVSRYPSRVKCALLGWMAFKDAVARAMATDEEEQA